MSRFVKDLVINSIQSIVDVKILQILFSVEPSHRRTRPECVSAWDTHA